MASNSMLLQAASGLTNLMSDKPGKMIKDTTVAQISAILYYKAEVIAQLENNKAFKEKFKKTVFKQIEKDFSNYIDAQARSKPKYLHHVYEWKNVGNPQARLFKLKQLESTGLSFRISPEFIKSKTAVPNSNKRKYVFANKASVMESGNPVIISPKNANRLVFEGREGTVFMPIGRSVTVKFPGGKGVRRSFATEYKRWFTGNLVNESIKKSGFFEAFQGSLKRALISPNEIKRFRYSFSPAALKNEASAALTKEFGGSLL